MIPNCGVDYSNHSWHIEILFPCVQNVAPTYWSIWRHGSGMRVLDFILFLSILLLEYPSYVWLTIGNWKYTHNIVHKISGWKQFFLRMDHTLNDTRVWVRDHLDEVVDFQADSKTSEDHWVISDSPLNAVNRWLMNKSAMACQKGRIKYGRNSKQIEEEWRQSQREAM